VDDGVVVQSDSEEPVGWRREAGHQGVELSTATVMGNCPQNLREDTVSVLFTSGSQIVEVLAALHIDADHRLGGTVNLNKPTVLCLSDTNSQKKVRFEYRRGAGAPDVVTPDLGFGFNAEEFNATRPFGLHSANDKFTNSKGVGHKPVADRRRGSCPTVWEGHPLTAVTKDIAVTG